MGFDISYHSLPSGLLLEQVYPYLLGEDIDLEDLIAGAVAISKIKFVAFRWGVAADNAVRELASTRFDTFLHVWGRPFFITVDEPQEILGWISEYQQAADADRIHAIAQEMLHRLDPSLVGKVEPVGWEEAFLYEEWEHDVRWKLDFVRAASLGLRGKGPEMVQAPSGDVLPAKEIVEMYFLTTALDFASHYVPGWYQRGRSWPRAISEEIGLAAPACVTGPEVLWTPVLQAFPQISPEPGEYNVDDFVRFDQVKDFRQQMRQQALEIEKKFTDPDDIAYWKLVFQKLDECLGCAELCNHSFVTAREIYSGPLGLFN